MKEQTKDHEKAYVFKCLAALSVVTNVLETD